MFGHRFGMPTFALLLATSPASAQPPPSLSIERQALLAAEPELGAEMRAQIERWTRESIRPRTDFADRYYRELPQRIIEQARTRSAEIDRIRNQARTQLEHEEQATFLAETTGNTRLQRLISFLRISTPDSSSEDIIAAQGDMAALVYNAIRNTNEHFGNRLREELERPDAATPAGRERIEALLNGDRRAVEAYLQAGVMRDLDPTIRQAFVAAGTRALAQRLHQQQRSTAEVIELLAGRVAVAEARMTEVAAASAAAVSALEQVAQRVDAHGRHVQQLATTLAQVAQTTNARLDNLSNQVRANGGAIDFILEASLGRLSPTRQVELLEQGYLPDIPNRDALLQSARDAERAEHATEGSRRWSERFGTAAAVAGAIASLGDALGLTPGQKQSLRDIQKGLLVAQSVASTYTAVTTAVIAGGPLQIGLALFRGVGEIANLTGAAAPSETEILLTQMQGLFREVFRQLEIINEKLNSLIRGQEAILRSIQDLGRRLDEVEENIIWEVRSVGSRIGDLNRVITDTILAEGLQACDDLIKRHPLRGLTIQDRYAIFQQNTAAPRLNFIQCEEALRRGVLFETLGGEFRVNSLFLFGTWWPTANHAGDPPPHAPIELDRDYYKTMLDATITLLNSQNDLGCQNQIYFLLARGPLLFSSVDPARFRCITRAQRGVRGNYSRLISERVLPEQMIQFADRVEFMAPFYAFADIGNGRWRPLSFSDAVARAGRGELPFQRLSTEQPQSAELVRHPGTDFAQAFLETLDVGIAQEGILAGSAILDRLVQILVPWNSDGPDAIEDEPLGQRAFWSNQDYVAAIAAEEVVAVRRAALVRARQTATEARDRRAPESERRQTLEELEAAQKAYSESIRARTTARAPVDENNLPRIGIERFNLASFGARSPPADGAAPRQGTRCRGGIDAWRDLENTHGIQVAGCLLRLNPLVASNFVAYLVARTLEIRGVSVAAYSIAYNLQPDLLMRRYLRGLPIGRVSSPYGQVWVLYVRDEHGGLLTIRLPSPERHAIGAIEFFPAMAGLTARRQMLRDLVISSVTDGGGNADLNAAIWGASVRR